MSAVRLRYDCAIATAPLASSVKEDWAVPFSPSMKAKQITKLGNHGLQVSGTPTTDKLRSFIILAWGGPYTASDIKATPAKIQPSSKPLDDLGLSHISNQLPNVKVSPHIVVTSDCESLQPSQKLPPQANFPQQQPHTYRDWPCPKSYTFAFTATEIIGKLAATQSPSVLFQLPPSN